MYVFALDDSIRFRLHFCYLVCLCHTTLRVCCINHSIAHHSLEQLASVRGAHNENANSSKTFQTDDESSRIFDDWPHSLKVITFNLLFGFLSLEIGAARQIYKRHLAANGYPGLCDGVNLFESDMQMCAAR